jgi:hypothetical protein
MTCNLSYGFEDNICYISYYFFGDKSCVSTDHYSILVVLFTLVSVLDFQCRLLFSTNILHTNSEI